MGAVDVLMFVLLYLYPLSIYFPQNSLKTQKPTGLSFSNPQNSLRFARQESTEMNGIYYKQSFLCLLSYDAQRLYALWIRENKPVGFCVFSEFCGNYKQRSYKQRSHKFKGGCRLSIIRPLTNHKLHVHYTNHRTPASPINLSLYHSEYRMKKKN